MNIHDCIFQYIRPVTVIKQLNFFLSWFFPIFQSKKKNPTMDRHVRMNGRIEDPYEMREVRFHDHGTKKQNSWGQKSKWQNERRRDKHFDWDKSNKPYHYRFRTAEMNLTLISFFFRWKNDMIITSSKGSSKLFWLIVPF